MMKSLWDGGDVDRVVDESLDASLDRGGYGLDVDVDVGFVGDEGPARPSPDFFFPSPNNDRFFDLPSASDGSVFSSSAASVVGSDNLAEAVAAGGC